MPDRISCEVLIVGAGPAGLAAACAACESGSRVAVIDDSRQAGGQIWRGPDGRTASPQAARWFARFDRARPQFFGETSVVAQPEPNTLLAETPTGALEFRYSKLILATGARERFLPFPRWTLPNVMGAGGLQALAKGGLPVAGKRVIVAGTGPLLPAVAAYLVNHGAVVPLIAEQASWHRVARFGLAVARSREKLRQALELRDALRGVRYLPGCWPVAAEGSDRLEAVVLRRGARQWREPCDYLACGFGLVPNLELPALLGCAIRGGAVMVDSRQQTSVPEIYCCGEPTGVGGVDLALLEGEIAGYSAAGRNEEAGKFFRAHARGARFRDVLSRAFALRDELRSISTADTIVCRCEDVTLGRIQTQPAWRAAKLQTRCGMGPCQARVCGPAIEFLLGWQATRVRPPVFPARVEHL